jgi:hypothetical protein
MPNGGPDNCSTCGFNRCNRGVWRNPAPDQEQMPFCEIRSVPITNDHWTYCQNWHTRTGEPIGPIYAAGLYEDGYTRIPWHGNIEPDQGASGICEECGAHFSDGLQIAVIEGAPRRFCCNLHYLTWWQREHPQQESPMSEGIEEEEN